MRLAGTQRNIEEAAKATGIAPNTLLKWMKEPEFQAALREARRGALRIVSVLNVRY
jgi:transposase-like protein